MLVFDTLAAISDNLVVYLLSVFISGLAAIGINYYYVKRFVGGLVLLQIYVVFNTAIILFGWWLGAVSSFRVTHFLVYEFTDVAGIYWLYRKILGSRGLILQRLQAANHTMVSMCLLLFNSVMCGLNLVFVPNNGGSRIEFMTASWFSFYRPLMAIMVPLGFFFSVYLLDRGKRLLPLLILASSVTSNILAGSKASFLYGIVCALLFYEDLKGARLAVSRTLRYVLIMGLSLSAVFALARLNASAADLAERFVRTAESTIMVYYSDDPTAAASGVSTFAKIHRGAAKVLGDKSAADVDTLFGFALSRLHYGANTFTGPNAQLSSYMLCNYSGWDNLIGLASILGYLAIVAWFCNAVLYRRETETVMLLPFAIVSLNSFSQDYYQGMSDVTVIGIAGLAFAWVSVMTFACRGARSVRGTA